MEDGSGGRVLVREKKDGNGYDAVNGTKGYRWLESEEVKLKHLEDAIDISYYEALAWAAKAAIQKYGDVDAFISGQRPAFETPPWSLPCGEAKYASCLECPNCKDDKCSAGFDIFKDVVKGGVEA